MLIEIRPRPGNFSGARGHLVSIDGNEGEWHYGPADQTTISVYTRYIKAHSTDGGKIINYDTWRSIPQEIDVPGCPTGHANMADDFMGGYVCLDCKAVW